MIEIRKVSKSYGSEPVLRGVSATFESARAHGIVGRNGSGKTVLLKCIAGLTRPDEGTIWVDQKRVGVDVETPARMGAIIEVPGFLPNASGYDNLRYLADISGRAGARQIRRAMKLCGLDPDERKWVSKYSLGMRQRLGMAQAIMENPTLLILDEPMNGLDNDGVEDARRLLFSLKERGKTILLASHNPQDIDALCDTVWEMNAGSITRVR